MHKNKPNVVFILADDLGWHDTSLYGSAFCETPNIDALAKRGMMFTNAYLETHPILLRQRRPERPRRTLQLG